MLNPPRKTCDRLDAGRSTRLSYLLPPGVVGVVGAVGPDGRLGDDLSVEPSLFPPLGVCAEELPLAADGLFDVLLVAPAPDWSRWQPASASAREAATIINAFMDPPLEKGILSSANIGPALPCIRHEDHLH